MSACILGRKIGMTESFSEEGKIIPISVVQAGPCKVLSERLIDKDGYQAVVVGFEEIPGHKVKQKARLGFFKKCGTPVFRVIREFRNIFQLTGPDLTVGQFAAGDKVTIEGHSKGKGWTGVIKKWNFSRGRMSHGGNCKRKMGSIGQHTWPARVIKGKKMSGVWGNEKITLKPIQVVQVIPEDHLLLIKGPLPGRRNSLLAIRKIS